MHGWIRGSRRSMQAMEGGNEMRTSSSFAAGNVSEYETRKTWSHISETFQNIFRTPSAKLGGVIFTIVVIACVLAPLIAPYDPYEMDLRSAYTSPCMAHLCGTDSMGRDIFSRLLYGGRYSLALALVADIFGHACGVIVGSIAGYYGGKVENLIMRLCDIWSAIPGLLLTILISQAFGAGFFNTVLALSVGGIAPGARLTRGQILAERDKEYLEAAESINCSKISIMFSHLLPNIIQPTIVGMTTGFGGTIINASGLSYLGLGVQPPTPEWGALLSEGTSVVRTYPYIILFPGLIIGITVLAVNLMGDGIRDALDPKLRQ